MTKEKDLRLSPTLLYRQVDLQQLDFETTAELETLKEVVGQPRAVQAIQFGIGMTQPGYNIFALGPVGLDKRELVRYNEGSFHLPRNSPQIFEKTREE